MARKNKLSTAQVIKNGEEIFHRIRWKNGIVVCPYCGSIHICEKEHYHYKCNSCKNRFSDRTRTIFHGSKLPISVCMQAIYEIFTDNFISSNVLATKLGINQKSAWLLRTKLNYSLPQDRWLLEGIVAHDELHIGGCLSNYHYSRKWDLLRKGNYVSSEETRYSKNALFTLNNDLKQPVFGLNDGKHIILIAIPDKKKQYLHQIYREHVKEGSISVCDESKLYEGWEQATGCPLHVNNHSNNQYITKGGYTSNPIENTFSWYKRGFGRITHCKYHQFYLNEFVFRYNTRNLTTEEQFEMAVGSTIGKHITYKQIKEYKPFSQFNIPKRKHVGDLSMEDIKHLLECGVERVEQNGRVYTRNDMMSGLF